MGGQRRRDAGTTETSLVFLPSNACRAYKDSAANGDARAAGCEALAMAACRRLSLASASESQGMQMRRQASAKRCFWDKDRGKCFVVAGRCPVPWLTGSIACWGGGRQG